MKLPMDLVAGDILHTIGRHHSLPQADVFSRYVTDDDGTVWADCKDYSFLVDTGIAEPTAVEVVRVQRVNSCATTLTMSEKLNTKDARIEAMSKESTPPPVSPSQVIKDTKLAIAEQLQQLLDAHYSDLHVSLEAYKNALIKEAQ